MRADAWTKGNVMEASSMMNNARSLTSLCNQLSKIDYMSNSFSISSFKILITSIRDILCTLYGVQGLGYTADGRLNKAIASIKGSIDLSEGELTQSTRSQFKKRGLTLVSDCIYISGYLTTQATYYMETATESLAVPSVPNKYNLPATSTVTENKVVPLSEGMSDAALYYAYGIKGRGKTGYSTQEIRKGLKSEDLSQKLIGVKDKTADEVKQNLDYKSEAEKALEGKLEGLAATVISGTLNDASNALGLSKYGVSLSSLISGQGNPSQMIGGIAQNVLGKVVGNALGNLVPNSLGGPVGSIVGQVTGEIQGAIGSLVGNIFKPGNNFTPDIISATNPAIAAVGDRVSMVDKLMPENSVIPSPKTGWDAINPTESRWDAINPTPTDEFDLSGGYPGQEGFGANNDSWEDWCRDNYEYDAQDVYGFDPDVEVSANDGRLGDGTRPDPTTETVNDETFADEAEKIDMEAPLTSEKENLDLPDKEAPSTPGDGSSDPRPGERSLTLPDEQKRRTYAHPKITYDGGELILQVRQKQVTEGVTPAVKRTFGARLIFIEEKSPISVNLSGFLIDYEGMDNVDTFLESLRKASIVEYDEYFQAKVPKQITLKIEGNEYKGILTGFGYGKSADNPFMYQTSMQFIGYELGERDKASGGTQAKGNPTTAKVRTVTTPMNPSDVKDKMKQQADSSAIKALRDRVNSVEQGIPQLSQSYLEQSVSYDYAYDGSSTMIPIMPNDRPITQSPSFNSVSESFVQDVNRRVGMRDPDYARQLRDIAPSRDSSSTVAVVPNR